MITKNKAKGNGSFYKILAANYVLFTCFVLLAFFTIYQGFGLLIRKIAPVPDVAGFIEAASEAEDGGLSRLEVSRYLGQDSLAELADEEGYVIFRQGFGKDREKYSQEELSCIQEYFSDYGFLAAELPEGSEGGSYMVTGLKYGENGEASVTGYVLLDQDRNVLSGSLFPRKESFTAEEFSYLKGLDETGRKIYKQSFTDGQGRDRIMVFHFREPSFKEFQIAYESWKYIWWFFIPAYVAVAALCIYFLNRKTKKLLAPFNQAIVSMKEGRTGQLEDYEGPEEFVEIAENFVRMESRLKKSSEERRRLLADISHDLKTPVTVIRGYATALKDQMIPPEEEKIYLETIVKKTEKISELLSAFHEYSKLDHPSMKPQLERADACEVCREYLAGKYQELELNGILLEADIPEQPIFCEIDKALFYRALDNLVQNSQAYGGPDITVFFSVKEEKGQAVISLGDNGAGISEELAEKIFQPFVTGDASRSGRHGSGLGMSIVKQIAALHGGDICLKRPPDPGCSIQFLITLPLSKTFTNL